MSRYTIWKEEVLTDMLVRVNCMLVVDHMFECGCKCLLATLLEESGEDGVQNWHEPVVGLDDDQSAV